MKLPVNPLLGALSTIWYHVEHDEDVPELEKVCGGCDHIERQTFHQREAGEKEAREGIPWWSSG